MQLVDIKKVKAFMAEKNMSEPEFANTMGITYSLIYSGFFVAIGSPAESLLKALLNAGMRADDIFLPLPLPKSNTGTDG